MIYKMIKIDHDAVFQELQAKKRLELIEEEYKQGQLSK